MHEKDKSKSAVICFLCSQVDSYTPWPNNLTFT